MLWSRFIGWVDRSLGDRGLPNVRSAASLLPFVPILLVALPLWYFDPPETVRYRVVGVAAIPAVALFGIWIWRLGVAARRYFRESRDDEPR